MDVCVKRHHRGEGPFAGVSLLPVAKLGCSVSITATWEVSWGSSETPLSWLVKPGTRLVLRGLFCNVPVLGPAAGAPVAGNGLVEPLPCCKG